MNPASNKQKSIMTSIELYNSNVTKPTWMDLENWFFQEFLNSHSLS